MTPKLGPLFAGLFGGEQSEKAKKDYLQALEEAARWLAEAEGLTLSEYLRNEDKPKWIN